MSGPEDKPEGPHEQCDREMHEAKVEIARLDGELVSARLSAEVSHKQGVIGWHRLGEALEQVRRLSEQAAEQQAELGRKSAAMRDYASTIKAIQVTLFRVSGELDKSRTQEAALRSELDSRHGNMCRGSSCTGCMVPP